MRPELSSSSVIESFPRSEEIETSERIATALQDGPAVGSRSRCDTRQGSRLLRVSVLAVWGVAIAAGFLFLQAYANRPGDPGRSRGMWPDESVIPLDDRRPTLVMFLHPFCPCSGASVDELAELAARCGDRISAHVVLLRTDSLEKEGPGGIAQTLAELPGIKTWQDRGGAEARRFGVLTSGHVLLYDPRGRLVYSGGITPSRGHRGENFGRAALLARILGEAKERAASPVFGCPLSDPAPIVSREAQR